MPFIIFNAWKIIKQTKPDCVLGVGGYVSGPAVLAASLAGIPTGRSRAECQTRINKSAPRTVGPTGLHRVS